MSNECNVHDNDMLLIQLHEMRRLLMNGWAQGHLKRNGLLTNDRYCLIGAARMASTGHVYMKYRDSNLETFIYSNPPSPYASIMGWNDIRGRRKEEVIAYVDSLIAKLEPGKPEESFKTSS